MSNGDWVIAMFNRETSVLTKSIMFSSLGLTGSALVRDLWQHADLGSMSSILVAIPPHGCVVYKLTSGTAAKLSQSVTFNTISDKTYGVADFDPGAVSTANLPVHYEIESGPASIVNNKIHLTGIGSGTVYVLAEQPGDTTYYGAVTKLQSFNVTGGHQSQMYVAGTFTGWSPNIKMNLVNDIWNASSISIPAGYNELKFANTNNWSGNDWGNASGLTGFASLTTGGKPNLSFTMPAAGSYDIYFDDRNLQYSIGSKISGVSETAPPHYELRQNYPNPFNPVTLITYSLGQGGLVTLKIFDILGQEIKTLIHEYKSAGSYQITFNASNFPSGIYFYSISTGSFISTKKMLLMK